MKIYHLADNNGNRFYYTAQAQANSARNKMIRDDGWVDMEATEVEDLLHHKDEELKLLEHLISKLAGKLSPFITADVSKIIQAETDKWNKGSH